MPEASQSAEGSDIGLAEMIEDLRNELEVSLEKGKTRSVAFEIDKVELELKVAISRKLKGETGVAFWVVKADGSLETGRDNTHTIRLTLSPVSATSGDRIKIASGSDRGPGQG